MTDHEWQAPQIRCLGVRLAGDAIEERDERGRLIIDDTLLILLSAGDQAIPFKLPRPGMQRDWTIVFDTANAKPARRRVRSGTEYQLAARSVVLLLARRPA